MVRPMIKKDEFYGKLQDVVSRVTRHDILLCVGDFNAVLGSSNEGLRRVWVKWVLEKK